MERRSGYCLSVIMLVFGVVFLHCLVMTSFAANVTYDHRALVVDGRRRVLISGSIHYPRSTPDVSFYFFFPQNFLKKCFF